MPYAAMPPLGYPLDYNPAKGRDKMYDQVHATVQSVEEKIVRARHGSPDAAVGLKVPLTLGDIAFPGRRGLPRPQRHHRPSLAPRADPLEGPPTTTPS